MKKIIMLAALLILLSLGSWAAFNLSLEDGSDLPMSAYSLEGQLLELSGRLAVVSVGRVEDGDFVRLEKEFALADTLTLLDGGVKHELTPESLGTLLKIGDRAVFTGSGISSPWEGGTLLVSKIDITSHKTPAPLPRRP